MLSKNGDLKKDTESVSDTAHTNYPFKRMPGYDRADREFHNRVVQTFNLMNKRVRLLCQSMTLLGSVYNLDLASVRYDREFACLVDTHGSITTLISDMKTKCDEYEYRRVPFISSMTTTLKGQPDYHPHQSWVDILTMSKEVLGSIDDALRRAEERTKFLSEEKARILAREAAEKHKVKITALEEKVERYTEMLKKTKDKLRDEKKARKKAEAVISKAEEKKKAKSKKKKATTKNKKTAGSKRKSPSTTATKKTKKTKKPKKTKKTTK